MSKDRKTVRTGDPRLFDVDEMRLKHALGRTEPLLADLDDPSIRQLQPSSARSAHLSSRMARADSVILDQDRRLVRELVVQIEVVPVRMETCE